MAPCARKFAEQLGDPRFYVAQIERSREKRRQNGTLNQPGDTGLTFATLTLQRRKLARLLAKAVANGSYRFTPARRRIAEVKGKFRILYVLSDTDQIVHGVVARILTDKLRHVLSHSVLSYTRGTTWVDGVSRLARYCRNHYKERRNPRERGLYVVRHDIREYTDSIAVDDGAPVWRLLHDLLLTVDGEAPPSEPWRVIQNVVRPVIHDGGSASFRNDRGIPTGSPITAVLYNLCASPLDRRLDHTVGAFYARYSDDIIFVHPNRTATERAGTCIVDQLTTLGLETNADKAVASYLTSSGSAPPGPRGVRPSTAIEFLGCSVKLNGCVFLRKKRLRGLLRDLEDRAERTKKLTTLGDRDAIGASVCAAINSALHPLSPFAHKYARFLASAVTDREQLRHLDYLIARLVLRKVTGSHSVRAFRDYSYGKLRREWGLISLYHRRNRKLPSRAPGGKHGRNRGVQWVRSVFAR